MDLVAVLKKRIADLTVQRDQTVASAHAVTGALQVCEQLLAEITSAPVAEITPS